MFTMKDIDAILSKNMTEDGYRFWMAMAVKIPNIWNRPSSSTGKYHKKENGEIQTICEHTYEMLNTCCKCFRIFNINPKTKDADMLLLGVVLHDIFKYGVGDPLYKVHTEKQHDRIAGNTVLYNKDKFRKLLTEGQINTLEEMLRFHSGRWSTDAPNDFNFKNYKPETLFLHLLDMLSTNNLLKISEV